MDRSSTLPVYGRQEVPMSTNSPRYAPAHRSGSSLPGHYDQAGPVPAERLYADQRAGSQSSLTRHSALTTPPGPGILTDYPGDRRSTDYPGDRRSHSSRSSEVYVPDQMPAREHQPQHVIDGRGYPQYIPSPQVPYERQQSSDQHQSPNGSLVYKQQGRDGQGGYGMPASPMTDRSQFRSGGPNDDGMYSYRPNQRYNAPGLESNQRQPTNGGTPVQALRADSQLAKRPGHCRPVQ